MIGKIKRVHLREVWKNEATDFTPWLAENIEILNEILDINLSSPECEKNAGAFNVDITAEDNDGNPVIIENQLEKSDHDHLGKLITYLTSIDAKIAIWIVAEPRPEHIRAVTWLNESGTAAFYMLKVEAVKIGESQPAPLLSLIVGPSEDREKIGDDKRKLAERNEIRHEFWKQFLEYAKTKTKLHAGISPTIDNYIYSETGISGLTFYVGTLAHNANLGLYIAVEKGKESAEVNRAILDNLHKHKRKIENEFGESLEWLRIEGIRECEIKKTITLGGYRADKAEWPLIHKAMVDAMIKLADALAPYLKKLEV